MSSRRARQFPAAIGERAAARSGLLGLAARCIARLGTRQPAFENDRDAEHRESEVKGGDGVLAPGALAIGPNIFILPGNSERVEIVAEQALIMIGRDVVADAVVGQIGERMAERGQFPIENADHPRLGGWNIRLSRRKSPWQMVVSSPGGIFRGSHSESRSIEGFSRVLESCHCRVQRLIWRT